MASIKIVQTVTHLETLTPSEYGTTSIGSEIDSMLRLMLSDTLMAVQSVTVTLDDQDNEVLRKRSL